jgi:oligosaccharide repeat unit polymerase
LAAFYIYGFILLLVVIMYAFTGFKFSLFNIYFGLFFVYYGPAFFIYNISLKTLDTDYAISTAYMLSLFIIGYFGGKLLFIETKGKRKVRSVNYESWRNLVSRDVKIKENLLYTFITVCSLIIILGLFFYGGINSLATLIRNPLADAQLIKELRQDSGVTGWIAPFYVYINAGIGRLLAFVFIGIAFKKKNGTLIFISFLFAILLSISFLANMSKSSFVLFYIQLIFFFLLYFNIRINFKKGFVFIILVVPVLIGIYQITTNASSMGDALGLIGFRIFKEPIRVIELYPHYYPDILPHTWGMNIRLIHDLFSSDNFVPAYSAITGGLEHASFNAMFIADAYVDFSYFGVIIQSVLVGFILSSLDYTVFSKNNYLHKALIASLLIGIFSLINVGLVTSLFGFGLITLPILSSILEIKRNTKPKYSIPGEEDLQPYKVR